MEVASFAALIFFLLSELAFATRTSLKESYLAFLSPRIASSEISALSSSLSSLMKSRDKTGVSKLLMNAGILGPDETLNFKDLWEVERRLVDKYEKRFDAFLFYMPDKLKSFFGEWKIIWDSENLKIISRCVFKELPPHVCLQMIGPKGNLSYEDLRYLSESKEVRELIQRCAYYLPSEMISRIDLKEETSMEDMEALIDRSTAIYLSEVCFRTKLEKPSEIRKLIATRYEIKDILTIARLKKASIPTEKIAPLLTNQRAELERETFESLISAENYPVFYSILSSTFYGSALQEMRGVPDPNDLEEALFNLSLKKLYAPDESSGAEEFIIRYMIRLDLEFKLIWRAILFALTGEQGS